MSLINRFLVAVTLVLAIGSAHALDKTPFSQQKFDELQEQGAVVLIDVYATWCPTCAKQQVVLEEYLQANPKRNLHILEVDYDDAKDIVRQFRAPRQSTMLIYKGKQQFWFSVAETRPEVIAAELDKAFDFKPKS